MKIFLAFGKSYNKTVNKPNIRVICLNQNNLYNSHQLILHNDSIQSGYKTEESDGKIYTAFQKVLAGK